MKKYVFAILSIFLVTTLANALQEPSSSVVQALIQDEGDVDTPATKGVITPAIKPEEKTKYRVGVSYVNDFPMFSPTNIEDKGLGWAILEKFAESQNIKFEYAAMPVTRLQPSMDSGALDFIFPDNPVWTSYRSNRLPNIFSGKVMSGVSATFVRKEKQALTFEEVTKVAIPFGYTAFNWIQPIQNYDIKSVPVRDLRTALFAVTQGSTDAADVEYNIGRYLIEQHPSLSGLTVAPNLPHSSVGYYLSSIRHITVLEELSAFLEREAALIEELRQQYNIKNHAEVYSPLP